MLDLGLKQRPVRMPNHNPWELENIEKVKVLHHHGCTPEIIAGYVGRSACGVRGLIERLEARNELSPQVVVSKKQKNFIAGISYKKALDPVLWPKAEGFMRLIETAKSYAKDTGICCSEVDLKKLRNVFLSIKEEQII